MHQPRGFGRRRDAGGEAVVDYARMAGTELLVIDETTTALEFENRIRANAAYYRLARGI